LAMRTISTYRKSGPPFYIACNRDCLTREIIDA
jgi:hypothetical protein